LPLPLPLPLHCLCTAAVCGSDQEQQILAKFNSQRISVASVRSGVWAEKAMRNENRKCQMALLSFCSTSAHATG